VVGGGWWLVAGGWLAGWLAGWLVGWLAGWLVAGCCLLVAGYGSLIGFDLSN